MLKFAIGNAKLKNDIAIFDLPAGHSCPGAEKCLALANRITGKITDGPKQEYRCYAASIENIYPNVRKMRWHNFDLVKETLKEKGTAGLIDLINKSLPRSKKNTKIRVHSSGDFFSERYISAWLEVANQNRHLTFYAYTKSVNFWQKLKDFVPPNFKLNASLGGKHDHLVEKENLKSVKVVFSQYEAKKLKLALDHDDSHAYKGDKSFALLLHNIQPAGTKASKAWQRIKKTHGGYSLNKKK